MFNKVILFGRLADEPDLYRGRGDMPVCRLRVETETPIPWRERPHREWTTVKVFGALADKVRGWKEGDLVSIEGYLHTTRWSARGESRQATEVVARDLHRIELAGGGSKRAA